VFIVLFEVGILFCRPDIFSSDSEFASESELEGSALNVWPFSVREDIEDLLSAFDRVHLPKQIILFFCPSSLAAFTAGDIEFESSLVDGAPSPAGELGQDLGFGAERVLSFDQGVFFGGPTVHCFTQAYHVTSSSCPIGKLSHQRSGFLLSFQG